jgi:hypothetical protein
MRANHSARTRLVERVWWVPLAVACAAFASCAPLHAMGQLATVRIIADVALAVAMVSVPLGAVALRERPATGPTDRLQGEPTS